MKHIFTGFSLIGAFALLALAVGCASMQTQNKENLLSLVRALLTCSIVTINRCDDLTIQRSIAPLQLLP